MFQNDCPIPIPILFFRHRFKSILSIFIDSEGYALGTNPPNMEQAKVEPPRPLPSIGLSNLDVRKRFELRFRFSIDFNGKSRTKPRMASEIRRVTEAWNTPACLYPSPPFDMCTRRRRIPSVSKRIHAIPSTKYPRLPVFALTLNSMERLDQGCDRRVESDFNTDSY